MREREIIIQKAYWGLSLRERVVLENQSEQQSFSEAIHGYIPRKSPLK